jgi:hypothetical protein
MVLFTEKAKPENLKQLGPHNDVFIAAHMANKLLGGHVVASLDTPTEVKTFREQSELSVILFADPTKDEKLIQDFTAAADNMPASLMTATATPDVQPHEKSGTCTSGEACLVVYHASMPQRTVAIAHTSLAKMDPLTIQAWMQKADIPLELRQGPFLSTWMQQIILVGSSEDTEDSGSIARNVFDYAAKGSSVYFSDEVLQTELAQKWVIEAAKHQDNLELPTMVMLDIEKGKLNQVAIWPRSLTPAEGEDQNAVVDEARDWAHAVTKLEAKPLDRRPTLSAADLANNPHLKDSVKSKEAEDEEAGKVIYDMKMSKEEELKAAGHGKKKLGGDNDIELPEGKDVSDLVESDFKSKDDYHTWMKNRRKEKAANEMAEELQKSGGGAWKKDEIYKMATSRSGMSSGAIEKVRKRHFLRHLYTKCIILPRQARDKHRENSKKGRFLAGARYEGPHRCGRDVQRDRH